VIKDHQKPESAIFICAINGSSRPDGQTAKRIKVILRAAEALGAKTELINLVEHPLQFCDGNQEPKMRRDIRAIIETLKKADGIIFGTPTYWFNMSGLMKNFIDRLTVTEKNWMLEDKVAGFVVTGSKDEDGAMMATTSMAAALNHLGMVIFPYSMLYFRGRSGPKWAQDDLRDFAKGMLRMIKLIRDGGPAE
jgi:multimeric flavodoxin WrbA